MKIFNWTLPTRRVWRYQRGKQKNRQHNGQKKRKNRTNNDLQNITHRKCLGIANLLFSLRTLKSYKYKFGKKKCQDQKTKIEKNASL